VLGPEAVEDASVEAARRGDRDAFNRLVIRYQSLVYNLAYRTLGNREDAADVTQETFFSAYRHLEEFHGRAFKRWLLRIAVNACYDLLRRRRRRPSVSLEELLGAEEAPLDLPARERGPELAALDAETAAAVQRGLLRLPEEQRLVVVLCDVQGLSYEEAADALGVPIGTVRSRLSRARARLRDELLARGELPGGRERPDR
jgi:RNA polymerase sigma-70 factor (ECF subfamily)